MARKVWVLALIRGPAVEDLDRWARFLGAFPTGWVHRGCSEDPYVCRARMVRIRVAAASREAAAARVVPLARDLAAREFGSDVEVDWTAQPAGLGFFLTRKEPFRPAAEVGGDGQVGVREPRRSGPSGFPPAKAARDEPAPDEP